MLDNSLQVNKSITCIILSNSIWKLIQMTIANKSMFNYVNRKWAKLSQDYLKWRLEPTVRNLASETWELVRKESAKHVWGGRTVPIATDDTLESMLVGELQWSSWESMTDIAITCTVTVLIIRLVGPYNISSVSSPTKTRAPQKASDDAWMADDSLSCVGWGSDHYTLYLTDLPLKVCSIQTRIDKDDVLFV